MLCQTLGRLKPGAILSKSQLFLIEILYQGDPLRHARGRRLRGQIRAELQHLRAKKKNTMEGGKVEETQGNAS